MDLFEIMKFLGRRQNVPWGLKYITKTSINRNSKSKLSYLRLQIVGEGCNFESRRWKSVHVANRDVMRMRNAMATACASEKQDADEERHDASVPMLISHPYDACPFDAESRSSDPQTGFARMEDPCPPDTSLYCKDHDFREPLVEALVATAPMRRLKDVGFLGAIDYIRHGNGKQPHQRRHSRFEHSVAVAKLADIYARTAKLPKLRRLTLLAAALLHDVGHGPLSHTLEPVFKAEFDIDHHEMTRRVISGDSKWGKEIRDLLGQAGVDTDEVLALVDGKHDGDIGFLFSRPINLDTLEGIARCRAFARRRRDRLSIISIVRDWASDRVLPRAKLDAFWELKHEMYNFVIHAPQHVALEGLAQIYMYNNISNFSSRNFTMKTKELRLMHPNLFKYLDLFRYTAGKPKRGRVLSKKIPSDLLNEIVTFKSRSFHVRKEVPLDGWAAMNIRYHQSKSNSRVELGDLLNEI